MKASIDARLLQASFNFGAILLSLQLISIGDLTLTVINSHHPQFALDFLIGQFKLEMQHNRPPQLHVN